LRKKTLILFFCGYISLSLLEVQALEQKVDDLSASVEVVSVFNLSLDNSNLAFGLISPGKEKVLGEGRFFNELRCCSNSGRTWYLKAHLISLKLLEKDYSLAPSNLKWKVVESTGSAEPLGRLEFKEFSEQPILIYASQGEDNRGKEVILRFQYNLSSPLDAPTGNYVGQIIFTMAESP
jgi:hypothetical protein